LSGLLNEHYTLGRHFYIVGLIDSPLCKRYGAEEETSAHVLFEREAWATLRRTYMGSYLLDPEDDRSLSLGVI
jgi:hypothetical protein